MRDLEEEDDMEFLENKEQKKLLYYNYGVFLLNGMLALSIGTLLPFIREMSGLDYAFCGFIVSLHSIGNLISSFGAGALSVKIGRKKSILLFNAFFALAYVLIALGGNKITLMLAFLMTGFARGATSNYCNTVINELAPGKAWVMNGLHAMFSVGAFCFPILVTLITISDSKHWIYACYFMIIMGILSWSLYYAMPERETKAETKMKTKTDFSFFRDPLFCLCTLTLFFYLCAEQGVIGWMVTYFKDTELLSGTLSQITASVLWIMILAGRLTTAGLSVKIKKERLLLAMGIGMVLFFSVLLTSRNTVGIVIGIMGFGYSMAGVYPTTVSFAGRVISKYPMAWSFMLTIASIGAIIMPAIIGKIAEMKGILMGMSSVSAVVLIDLLFIIVLTVYSKRFNLDFK